MVQRDVMPTFEVQTAQHAYTSVIERGILHELRQFVPAEAGKLFLVTTPDVWELHGAAVKKQFAPGQCTILFFPGGEPNKRLTQVEELAEQMVAHGADRTSLVIGFGGGIVTDVSGFLAAIFMRGVPVIQVPTTLLAQVDAAVGGKTGVNLASGKNLIGSFHQPLSVVIDPEVLRTLPEREYRAGLFEVIKCGIIRDPGLFRILETEAEDVLRMKPSVVDEIIAAAVRIKAEVVSADEKESDLRRILNFGHTIGHAIEAETAYSRFLHGEAVALGMLAATRLAELVGLLDGNEAVRIQKTICAYGPIPPADDLSRDRLIKKLGSDKKTLGGKVHFVLPTAIGNVKVVPGVEETLIRQAMSESLHTIV
jgi:3-dehydroquinate synthase